jgi:hypothetical protein
MGSFQRKAMIDRGTDRGSQYASNALSDVAIGSAEQKCQSMNSGAKTGRGGRCLRRMLVGVTQGVTRNPMAQNNPATSRLRILLLANNSGV